MNFPWRLLLGLALAWLTTSGLIAATPAWTHRGFTVTAGGEKIDDAMAKALAEQIDLVHAVGLDAATIAFFQQVPLVAVSAGTIARNSPGLYVAGDRTVKLTTRIATVGRRPVLLHELLHAYHHQKLKGGFENRDVQKLFADAQKKAAFEAKSHMMANAAEYFACAGTTYLHGTTAQEPFRREKLAQQPELGPWLQKLFGPGAGHYEGTVEASAAPEK